MRKRIIGPFAIIGALSVFLFACSPNQRAANESGSDDAAIPAKEPKRVGMVTGLKPEKAAYYKELHADTWEGVLATISDYHIRNYSIYLKEIEGKLFLFSYYEYIGDDYEGDMKGIAADSTTRRWWRETDPCQLPLQEAAEKGTIWTPMEEVFHAQ